MAEYARVDGETIIERRELASIPPHKAHLWRPVVYEGDGPLSDIFIEPDRVRVSRSNPPITTTHVKAECRRRILDRYPDWKQSNMLAHGLELQDLWRINGEWTTNEQAEAEALAAAWDWIKAVRAASDAIESMQPIPADYADNARWPA